MKKTNNQEQEGEGTTLESVVDEMVQKAVANGLLAFGVTPDEFFQRYFMVDQPTEIVAEVEGVGKVESVVVGEGKKKPESVHVVRVRLFDSRKLESLAYAFQQYADAEGRLDLAIASRFAMGFQIVQWPGDVTPRLPIKGQRITLSLGWADATDRMGQRFLEVRGYQIPEPKEADTSRQDAARAKFAALIARGPATPDAGSRSVEAEEHSQTRKLAQMPVGGDGVA